MTTESPKIKGISGTGSKRDASFVYNLLTNESSAESLVSRGYAIIKLPTETSFIYSSFYSLCKLFFNSSDKIKQSYSQIQFNENNKSPNSLHGYSLVKNTKQQFMIRYINSTSNQKLKQMKTPNNAFNDDQKDNNSNNNNNNDDFGVLGLLLFEKLDVLSRNIMNDVLTLYNKQESILNDILDPINISNGNISRDKQHCFGEYTLNGYISSSVLDCYHYFGITQNNNNKDKSDDGYKYGHNVHNDSGLITLIPMTFNNPSLQVFDQKEDEWINIEKLLIEYCNNNDKDKQYGIVILGESVNPYINKHINNLNNTLKPCFYRIDNGKDDRFSVVYKQRTAPLRSHARYQEDFFLAKLHSEIDVDSVHARLMKGKQDKSKDYINYKYYEYTNYDKTKIGLFVGCAVVLGFYLLKRQRIIDVNIQFNLR